MASKDGLDKGEAFIESILDDIKKAPKVGETTIPLSDKLKAFDSWVKFKALKAKIKTGGLGSGFEGGDEDETGRF